MADQLQLRGGTTAQTATFTGALREVTVDTDKDTLVVHDNALAGGYPLLRQDLSNLPAGTIDNADINASAAIVDTKLATIATAGKVSNSATTATDANTASAIVARDASGNFTAGTITAALTGAASSNVLKAGDTMTGALVVPLASAATPSITFTGDLNTGIYSPGADQVAISTGGTGRLFIDSSGRLLVGTSTARDKLFNGTTSTNIPQFQSERAGGGLVNRLLVTGNNGTVPANEASQLILARSYGTTLNSYTAVTSADSHLGAISFQGADGTEFVEAASIQCFTDAACGANDMPGRIVLATTADGASSPTERMRIDSAGNVGIGTTSPGQSLDVNGNIRVGSNQRVMFGPAGFEAGIKYASSGNFQIAARAGESITFNGGEDGTERARIDSSGRLLVGTSTAPSTGSWNQYAKIVNTGTTNNSVGAGVLALNRNTAATSITATQGIGVISFGDSAGNEFGLIQCLADANAGTNDYPGVFTFSATADGASSPTERMSIASDGKITFRNGSFGIAASSIGSSAGNSDLRYNTATGIVSYDSSSALIKENITDCPYGIEAVTQLKPRKYFRTDDQQEEIGFIADELVLVMPEFVPMAPKSVITKNEEDTEEIPIGVNYSKLTAVLTKALQEAITKIETLEARLTAAGID
jgi:hypothetical protein